MTSKFRVGVSTRKIGAIGSFSMIMKDLHTNRYPRKHKDEHKLASLFGTWFGLVVVGAYFGFILYILCFIHQTPVTYP